MVILLASGTLIRRYDPSNLVGSNDLSGVIDDENEGGVLDAGWNPHPELLNRESGFGRCAGLCFCLFQVFKNLCGAGNYESQSPSRVDCKELGFVLRHIINLLLLPRPLDRFYLSHIESKRLT